jgi:hypothetical protein
MGRTNQYSPRRNNEKFNGDAFWLYTQKRFFTNTRAACSQTASHAPNFANTRRAIRGGRLEPWRNATRTIHLTRRAAKTANVYAHNLRHRSPEYDD